MAEKKPWEEDYTAPVATEKKPWEEDYTKPQAAPGTYLDNIFQPANDLEAKLTERDKKLASVPNAAKPAGVVNYLAGATGDVLGTVAKTAVNVIPRETQFAINDALNKPLGAIGSRLGKLVPESWKQNVSDVVQGAGIVAKEHPIASEYAAAVPNALGMGLPLGKSVETIGRGVTKAAGEGLENVSKTALAGEMKIPNRVAKKAYGSGLDEQKAGIIDDISRFNLHSPTGNFSSMADKAQSLASKNSAIVDDIITTKAADTKTPLSNPLFVAKSNLAEVPIAAGSGKAATNIIQKIEDDFVLKGYDGDVTLDKLVAAKKYLNADGKIFTNGTMVSDADDLNHAIRKNMYHSIVDKISKLAPETKGLNQDTKRLIDISSAATEAAGRKTNHSLLGLMGIMGGAGGMAHGGTPEGIAAALATIVAGRAAGQGRLASVGLSAGKGLQSLSRVGLKEGAESTIPSYSDIGKLAGTKGASIADALKRKLDEQKAKRK